MDEAKIAEYIANLEVRIDRALKHWSKLQNVDRGRIVQLIWKMKEAQITVDIFWSDDEGIRLLCQSPKLNWLSNWAGFTRETASNIMDRIGNFAQIIAGR